MTYTHRNPSPAYYQALVDATAHHASSKTYSGKFLRPHAPYIRELLRGGGFTAHGKLLDYGCGKGEQYRWVSHGEEASIPKGETIAGYLDSTIYLYDPAWPPYQAPPDDSGPFDMTLVTHVLGSIPVEDLADWVMPRLIYLTKPEGIIYIAEKLGDVNKDVFRDTSGLPRWNAAAWRKFAMIWSAAASVLGQEIVLSLRHRGGGETIVERYRYNQGREEKWQWTPSSAPPTGA